MTKDTPTTEPASISTSSENTNGLAIASLVLGILSVTGFFIFTGIPAIITGIMSLRKKQKERGMSIAGIIMGSIGTLLSLLFILVLILVIVLGIMNGSPIMQGEPSFNMDMPVESSRT